MTEHFETIEEAKLRRNELLDASAYAQRPSFAERYTHKSVEDFLRYNRRLYEIVDEATYPADIEWPEVPVPQTITDFNASLPKAYGLSTTLRVGSETRSGQKNQNE